MNKPPRWQAGYNPFPYLVIRLIPGIYRKVELDNEVPIGTHKEHIRRYTTRAGLRCCLAISRRRCIYFEADGSATGSRLIPSEGFVVETRYDEWLRMLALREAI